MLAAFVLSAACVGDPSPAVTQLLDLLHSADGWRRGAAQRQLGALSATQVLELIAASGTASPQGRLAAVELLALPGKHLGGVVLACADQDALTRDLAADIVERAAIGLQHRRGLDGIEEDAERRSQRIFPIGLVLGQSASARPCSLPIMIDKLDRFARPLRPIVVDPQLARQWCEPMRLELAPEPAAVAWSRVLALVHAEVQRLPSLFVVAAPGPPSTPAKQREQAAGAQQLKREQRFVRSLAESLRADAETTVRCAALVALVRFGLFGIGAGLLPVALEEHGNAAQRALAIDAVAAAAALPTGEALDAAVPALLAELERTSDALERYLLVEALCQSPADLVAACLTTQPGWLARADGMHIAGRLRLRAVIEQGASRAGDERWAFELCRAAARVGNPPASALRAVIVKACTLPEAAAELARFPWTRELKAASWLRETAGARELWYYLQDGTEIIRLVADVALPIRQRLRVARRAPLAPDAALALSAPAAASDDDRLVSLALRARAAAERDVVPTLDAAERRAIALAFARTDLDGLDLAELVADLQHPQATDLMLELSNDAPAAPVVARIKLALERLAMRMALGDGRPMISFKRRLEALAALPPTELFRPLRELVRGTIWDYELAEDAGRALMLLDELESFSP